MRSTRAGRSASRVRRSALVGAIGLAVLIPAGSAAAATGVSTCGTTLTAAGSYELTQDLVCDSDNFAITINASDVDLSLGGHTLSGGGIGSTGVRLGYYSVVDNVHVTGPGTTTAFTDGVQFSSATNSTVSGLTSTGNSGAGVSVFQDPALGGDRIIGNDVSANSIGIDLYYGAGLEVADNICSNSSSTGIASPFDGSSGHSIHGNTCDNNANAGILIGEGSGSNTLTANTATGNGGYDAYDGNANCGTNVWSHNTFVTFTPPCVNNQPGPAVEGPAGSASCTNSADDDGDALVDAADPDCAPDPDASVCDSASSSAGVKVTTSAIVGTSGNDTIVGTPGNDTIRGNGGNDTICAGDGNDTVYGGAGNDTLFGQVGADKLQGQAGLDVSSGGDGTDTITDVAGDDSLYGGGGDDVANGGIGADKLYGGEGDDTLTGAAGDDTLGGQQGDDDLRGSTENDLLDGGEGDDALNGGKQTDACYGGTGTNTTVSCEAP